MVRRALSLLLIAWLLGFAWFAVALPQPLGSTSTDAAIVLTGGEGRVACGLEVLEKGWAGKLLVSGVDREVRPREFIAAYGIQPKLMECCVTLGFESVDTRSNALESARWIARGKIRSVRLVTTDWHMRRAALELRRVSPKGVKVIFDAVPSQPTLETLFVEYHKLLARWLAKLWGG